MYVHKDTERISVVKNYTIKENKAMIDIVILEKER